MRALGTAALTAALLATSACGQRTDPAPGGSAEEAGWHGCTAEQAASSGRRLALADLDADGADDEVRLVGTAEASCAGLVAVIGDRAVGADLDGVRLDPSSARVVHLTEQSDAPAGRDLLLVGEPAHPRGGRQMHLFAADAHELGELTVQGNPVLPFFATDGGGAPMTATCTPDGGFAVVSAETHRPPGIVLAWDVGQVSYRVDGTRVVRTGAETVKEGAADPLLRKSMPELFSGRYFTDCSERA
jgi:hypothetical protein